MGISKNLREHFRQQSIMDAARKEGQLRARVARHVQLARERRSRLWLEAKVHYEAGVDLSVIAALLGTTTKTLARAGKEYHDEQRAGKI